MGNSFKKENSLERVLSHDKAFLAGSNAVYIEQLYQCYREAPGSLDSEWRDFFDDLNDDVVVHTPSWQRSDWPKQEKSDLMAACGTNWQDMGVVIAQKIATHGNKPMNDIEIRDATLSSVRAIMMIRAYRVRGHLASDFDPLKLKKTNLHPELDPLHYGFTDADMDKPIFIDNVLGLEYATIPQMLDVLRRIYCGRIVTEYMHISDPEENNWLQLRVEGVDKKVLFTKEGKLSILKKLIEAEGLEKFIGLKYIGTKRFGLDGAESMLPALEQIIKRGGSLGVKEIIIGMPHRGRLNVLANVMGKPFRALFNEFKGGSCNPEDIEGSGDVKYHLGTSSDRVFDGNTVHLSLTANPSHLEAVDPVVLGRARAKQDKYFDKDGMIDRSSVIPLLLHGDAAFAGQGIVAECLGLSGLKGHRSGGSVHFIVNNQIGFTTDPRFSRSSPYPSDVAKMVEAPIFHVNGDDPEAVVFAAKVATEFRQKFQKPVVMDMFCYRRFGHNEGDDPAFTQPHMYERIKNHDSVVILYANRLIQEGIVTQEQVTKLIKDYRQLLEKEFQYANDYKPQTADWLAGGWSKIGRKDSQRSMRCATGVASEILLEIGEKLIAVPEKFNLHPVLMRQNTQKHKMFTTGEGFDWATTEALAFGSLLQEGYNVRLSGQDSERGTFSQRHSVWIDQKSEQRHMPLTTISDKQGDFEVINSMLSEVAVLGFEYGYSLVAPNTLTLWEAQFGDFANGAQVIIDQFIASGEAKWLRMSGLVLLLPHGYEGQGPEHSSARLERYLQLCGEDNMQVVNVTTPANYFHILRRQLHRHYRKPLVIMTPKSLLRHKLCVSYLSDMETGSRFHRILRDHQDSNDGGVLVGEKKIRRVVLCTGKVYYDLKEVRDIAGIKDVYLMRIEELYPFPKEALEIALAPFAHAEMIWCQEEPRNMGAWSFIEPYIEGILKQMGAKYTRPVYVGRVVAASTATGLLSHHLTQRDAFISEALGLDHEVSGNR